MKSIGVIGTGVAGLHFALHLQKHGVPVTLIGERTLDEMKGGRLPNTVALMPATVARHRAFGSDHWPRTETGTTIIQIRIAGEPPLVVRGEMPQPMLFIDMRVYLPRLLSDFLDRGGKLVHAAPSAADVAALAESYDLTILASGRDGLTGLFPRIPERCPYDVPQRRLFGGLFRGIRMPDPFALGFNISPGNGEVFENQFFTHGGHVNGLLVEAIPGGAFEPLTRMRYEDDPAAFNAAVLDVLRVHAPDTYARTDPAAFALTGPLDTLSGAVTPVVRRGVASLGGGKFALALGDTHITHDPIVGQGANAAARAAHLLGEMVIEQARLDTAFDEAFCQRAEEHIREELRAVTDWTNAFLQPPPPHAIGLLVAAAQNQALADAFISKFDDPKQMWSVIADPAATAAFVAKHSAAE